MIVALEPRTKRTSIPTFSLTGKVTITVIRQTGSWVRGRWVEDDGVDVEIEGNIQPLKFHEIQQLPESDRTKEWIKLYTTDQIYTAEESSEAGRSADVLIWNGKRFKAMKARRYQMGVLDHVHVLCAREPISAE